MPSIQPPDIVRSRVAQVFRYLEALNQLRNPVVRRIEDQPWRLWLSELPEHESVRLETPSRGDGEEGAFTLQVRRAEIHRPPPPSPEVAPWLLRGWDDPEGPVSVRESRNESGPNGTTVVRFSDDPARVRLFQSWKANWASWAAAERPARAARRLFERLYALHGELEREGERLELVLGDGLLNWRVPQGGVNHPVLLQRLRLSFDPRLPEFLVEEADHEPELYSALFRVLPDVDAEHVARRRAELTEAAFHPLGTEDTAGFFRALVNPLGGGKGEYIGQSPLRGEEDSPRLGRAPVLFVRTRTLGFASAIEKIIERIPHDDGIPDSLGDIVGVERQPPGSPTAGTTTGADDRPPRAPDVLLSKEANAEQVRIVERLEERGAVIVQGPPGTGKTHTIANLLGHLLAHGKSVLVTSHTEKALQRVRDQVVEPLRPLCVSVLSSDAEGRQTLQDAVAAISARLGEDPRELEQEAATFDRRRRELLLRQRGLEGQLTEALRGEYEDVVVGGRAFPPSDAARHVAGHARQDGWVPTPVELGAPLPLSEEEAHALYRTNGAISPEDERELSGALPDPIGLPSPAEFAGWIGEIKTLSMHRHPERGTFWTRTHGPSVLDDLRALAGEVGRAAAPLSGEWWVLEALEAGRSGGPRRELWVTLVERIRSADAQAAEAEGALIEFDPALDPHGDLEEQAAVLVEIVAHLRRGGNLNFVTLLLHGPWKGLIERVSVRGRPPQTLPEFEALRAVAHLELVRTDLLRRWERMIAVRGGLPTASLGPFPERELAPLIHDIERYVGWFEGEWSALTQRLVAVGFDWSALLASTPVEHGEYAELRRIGRAVERLGELVKVRVQKVRLEELKGRIGSLHRHLQEASREATGTVVAELATAVNNRDGAGYTAAHGRLARIYALRGEYAERLQLLDKLRPAALGWSGAVESRVPLHDGKAPPGEPGAGWLWRQLHDALEVRAATDVADVQRQLDRVKGELLRVTSALIERRAWASQIRRVETSPGQRQALKGWAQTMRRIGAGTGKRAPKLRREARELMARSRGAVPVWVMPLAGVVDSFNPLTTRFDVVVIDEASQMDVMGLIALYMAREVVVVGDHEQVSPAAVGQNIEDTEYLIREHLQGIPTAHLYDGKASVYDLAERSFGRPIPLVEHFRCVPDIIAFSNALSYNFSIKPLRDASQVSLRPHVVPHRVPGARSDAKVNEAEAHEVASLVVAATEHPAYEGATFGVVTLVGDAQATLIDDLIRDHLTPLEHERRRILCGNPASFQGDERDVVFVSVVDAPKGGPLPLRKQDLFKQRFNVAASRARDQMWVVHSLNPAVDLKPEDLRRRLIEHAYSPQALVDLWRRGEAKTESEFEKRVLARLASAGYHVVPQWEVGAYRIDLVVVGAKGEKLAVECDGDRFHPPEKLAADLERQAILERLGWRFSRIRGSVFFRDPDRAMAPVFARLEELDVAPSPPPTVELDPAEGGSPVEDVVRRAAELRREWGHATHDNDENLAASQTPVLGNEQDGTGATSTPLNIMGRDGVRAGVTKPEAPSFPSEGMGAPADLFGSSPPPPLPGFTGSNAGPESSGLLVGVRVRHAVFGVGNVIALEGEGDRETAIVRFHTHGEKKLKVRMAGLRVIDGWDQRS